MKLTRLLNALYERLLQVKEDNWMLTKAATSPFIVAFGILLLVAFFAVIYLIQAIWPPG